MEINLHNTMTGRKELFVPLMTGKVSIYNCGPTVYNYAHIGNFRTYIFGDLLRRMFEYNNYSVHQVMNITDVDDKTIRGSAASSINLKDFTKKYEDIFKAELSEAHILTPHQMPRATDFIDEMITLIESLLEKGAAYKTEDGVYFSIDSSEEYGALAQLDKHDHKDEQHRIAADEYDKENPQDFALWKFHTAEDGDVSWPAPFGAGRPGWHIECSAMSLKTIGETIDIHTGATDLIFPHHTNEIAQSEAMTGKKFVNYWLHAGFLMVDGRRMSKSANNFYTFPTLKEKGISPLMFRYWLLGAHYRTQVNFTEESVRGAAVALDRLISTMREYKTSTGGLINEKYQKAFLDAINDDLNTAKALATTWDLIKDSSISHADKYATIIDFDRVFGLGLADIHQIEIPAEIQLLIKKREVARQEKNWKVADELRDEIAAAGFDVKDSTDGQIVSKI